MSASRERTPWYRSWFGEEYLSLYPHRDHEEAQRAVDLLVELLELPSGARVLDLACGAGRHLKALVDHELTAIGLDLSLPLLQRAGARVPGAPLVRGDMRSLPFVAGSFDAATSFFTSFGYFESDEEDRQVLRELRRILRPGGRVLLDFLNSDAVAEDLTPRDVREVEGRRVIQERRLVDGGRMVEKRIHLAAGPGDETGQEFVERVRLYTPSELEDLMYDAGLVPESRMGSYSGDPFDRDSPRVIVVAAASGASGGLG